LLPFVCISSPSFPSALVLDLLPAFGMCR
jgi:hypothetical protein